VTVTTRARARAGTPIRAAARPRPEATFTNPVLPGFHPDPSVCRVGRDFYLVTSSFEYFPGIPIFHSRDLVHWHQLGHVLTRRSQLRLHRARSSGGIYAATIRHAHGRFYVVSTNVSGRGNFYVTARDAAGPWSEPVWLDREGIDPSLFFQGDRVIYTRNGPWIDPNHPRIYQAELAGPASTPRWPAGVPRRATGAGGGRGAARTFMRPIWEGLGGIWPEGPHLFARGGHYYLLTAEGGTAYDHSVVIARGPTPDGPFESFSGNPILTHRDRPRERFQALGHADLVDLPDGSTWAMCLGIRPVGGRHHHLGRETFLAPVTWTPDGWPVIGRGGRMSRRFVAPRLGAAAQAGARATAAVHRASRTVRDDFDQAALRPEWCFLRNPRARDWSLAARPGVLRLRGSAVTLHQVDAPAFLGRRQQHFECVVRARLEFSPKGEGDEAGLAVFANERFHYTLAIRAAGAAAVGPPGRAAAPGKSVGPDGDPRRSPARVAVLTARVAGEARVVATRRLDGAGALVLGIRASKDAYRFFLESSPDEGRARPVVLGELGRLPTRHLSSETIWKSGQSFFTGVFFALYATGNGGRARAPADFDWFDYAPGARAG
jgi:alpha-N-arabinofuranosidase